MPRNALGRGLSALIREPEPASSQTQPPPLQPQVQVPDHQIHSTQFGVTSIQGMTGAATAVAVAPAPSESFLHVDIDLIDLDHARQLHLGGFGN